MSDWCECDWLLNNTVKTNNSLSKFLSKLKFMSISKTRISKGYKDTCLSILFSSSKFETIWSNCDWINSTWKSVSNNTKIISSLTNTNSRLTDTNEGCFWGVDKFFTSVKEVVAISKQSCLII